MRPLPLQDFVAAVAVPHHMTFESCDVIVCEFVVRLGHDFRCGRCRCRISLRPLPLQDFVAAVAVAGLLPGLSMSRQYTTIHPGDGPRYCRCLRSTCASGLQNRSLEYGWLTFSSEVCIVFGPIVNG